MLFILIFYLYDTFSIEENPSTPRSSRCGILSKMDYVIRPKTRNIGVQTIRLTLAKFYSREAFPSTDQYWTKQKEERMKQATIPVICTISALCGIPTEK